MTIGLASCDDVPDWFAGNIQLAAALQRRGIAAQEVSWTATAVDWTDFDLIVLRSTWDYTAQHERFVAWIRGLPTPVLNPADLVVWNSDKRYLADLADAGIKTVPTTFVAPDEPIPVLTGEVVIKPSVSAGGRLTGRFAPDSHDAAQTLIGQVQAAGKTAMVQPFLGSVDSAGETAVVLIDGDYSHALRKGPVLRPNEVAPTAGPGQPAVVMSDPDLVQPAKATSEERAAAQQVLAEVRQRFGQTPLYLRVDLLAGPDGRPVLLELEAVEPNLYFDQGPGSADRMAAAIGAARARIRPALDGSSWLR